MSPPPRHGQVQASATARQPGCPEVLAPPGDEGLLPLGTLSPAIS